LRLESISGTGKGRVPVTSSKGKKRGAAYAWEKEETFSHLSDGEEQKKRRTNN